MQKAKLITGIRTSKHGTIGQIGTEVIILDSARADLFLQLHGIKTIYAGALPKSAFTSEEVEALEDMFDDDSGDFYHRMEELRAAAPEGYLVTTLDDTEIELVD